MVALRAMVLTGRSEVMMTNAVMVFVRTEVVVGQESGLRW